MTEMGFNGAMFDIEPLIVSKDAILESNEAKIQHIIDNRLINKAGEAVQNWPHHCQCASGTDTGSGEADCSVGC